jgi:hypothetical protein
MELHWRYFLSSVLHVFMSTHNKVQNTQVVSVSAPVGPSLACLILSGPSFESEGVPAVMTVFGP